MEMRRLWSQNRNGRGFAAFLTAKTGIFHLTHPRTVSHGQILSELLKFTITIPFSVLLPKIQREQCRRYFIIGSVEILLPIRDLDSLLNVEHSLAEPPRDKPSKTNRKQASLAVSSDARVHNPICIFCMWTAKYIKGNQNDKLVKCVDLQADDTVRGAAVRKNDSRLIALVSRETVPAEVHYHRTCYRDYSRPASQESKTDKKSATTSAEDVQDECEETLYSRAETASYNELFNQIRSDLYQNPKVV